MGLSYEELFQAIIENMGNETNIEEITLDRDRLKFMVRNKNLIKEENLKRINGVNGIIEADNYWYLILDKNQTLKVFNEFSKSSPRVKASRISGKKNFIEKLKDLFKNELDRKPIKSYWNLMGFLSYFFFAILSPNLTLVSINWLLYSKISSSTSITSFFIKRTVVDPPNLKYPFSSPLFTLLFSS